MNKQLEVVSGVIEENETGSSRTVVLKLSDGSRFEVTHQSTKLLLGTVKTRQVIFVKFSLAGASMLYCGSAVCAPEDRFDMTAGVKLALWRARDKAEKASIKFPNAAVMADVKKLAITGLALGYFVLPKKLANDPRLRSRKSLWDQLAKQLFPDGSSLGR